VGGGWRQVAGLRLRTVAVCDLRESQIAPEPRKSATCRLRPRSRPEVHHSERSLRPCPARFSPPRTSRGFGINHLAGGPVGESDSEGSTGARHKGRAPGRDDERWASLSAAGTPPP